MTTIRNFINSSLDKGRVDYNNDNDFQCVELIKEYLKQVFGERVFGLGDGKDTYNGTKKHGFSDFQFNKNNHKERPKLGDVISFGATRNNKYGHTGLIVGSNEDTIFVLEQNYGNGNGNGMGGNYLHIREKSYRNITGITRSDNIENKILEDDLDKVSFYTGIHIWQRTIKRKDILEPLFYFLAGNESILYGKTYRNLNITSNMNNDTTRQELVYIILAFLNKVLGKNLSIDNLTNAGVWNGQRKDHKVSGLECIYMLKKAKEVYC